MRVVIHLESGPRGAGRWLLRSGERMVFGRSERADVVIGEDLQMSGCHFRVSIDQHVCRLEDLESTNGTWIDDHRIAAQQLCDGDRVRAGQSVFRFDIDLRDAKLQSVPETEQTVPAEDRAGDRPVVEPIEFDTRETELDRPSSSVQQPGKTDQPPQVPPASLPHESATSPEREKGELHLRMQRCQSGLFRAAQSSSSADPVTLVDLLGSLCPHTFMIDFSRAGVDRAAIPAVVAGDDGSGDHLMAGLPTDVLADGSPRLIRAEDASQRNTWLQTGWGSDAIVVLFSYVDPRPLLEHFQQLMRTNEPKNGEPNGLLGLSRPSAIEKLLCEGDPNLAAEIVDPCEALLVESNEAPGGWALLGDKRLPELLSRCLIPLTHESES